MDDKHAAAWRSWAAAWPAQALAWCAFAVGLTWAGFVGLMLIAGGTWAKGIYASRPLRDAVVSLAAFFVWHALRRAPRYTARDWLRWGGRTALLAASLALSLGAAEVALRIYLHANQERSSIERLRRLRAQGRPIPVHTTHPLAMIVQPSDNLRLIYDLLPSLDLDFGHHRVRTNKAGMRQDGDIPTARSPHSVRIAGIGDSGMFGWDVEQDESYMAVLASRLRARAGGVRYEVLNLAVPGYNTQLEVESLRSKGLAYRPDVVVVGWCDNDFGLPVFVLQNKGFRRRDVSFIYCLLFDRVRFADIAQFQIRNLREFDHQDLLGSVGAGTDREGVKRALLDLKAMAAENSFHVLLFGPMGPPIRELCREIDLPFYHTREKIPADRYPADFAIHFMHPAPGGHRVLAEALERELDARGWLSPR